MWLKTETVSFVPEFMLKKDRFTKTGSGHTQEKLTKKIAFRSNQARAAAGAPDSHRNGFACEGV
jgi:hypothetical protein